MTLSGCHVVCHVPKVTHAVVHCVTSHMAEPPFAMVICHDQAKERETKLMSTKLDN